jgi:hypothetical protein
MVEDRSVFFFFFFFGCNWVHSRGKGVTLRCIVIQTACFWKITRKAQQFGFQLLQEAWNFPFSISITDRWTICVFSGIVHRKLRYDCNYYCREKWGSKVYLENSYYFQGYWRILTEKFEEMMAKYKPGLYGDERWPFITHFVGCEFCVGAVNPEYSSELCISQMERAVNFADNQVLSLYGFKHPTLGANSVRPVARQATTSLFVSTYLPSSSPAPTSLQTLVGVLRTRSNGFSWELPGYIYIYKHNSRPDQQAHWQPQVKLSGKGKAGLSLAHQWVWEPRTSFEAGGSQTWAISLNQMHPWPNFEDLWYPSQGL